MTTDFTTNTQPVPAEYFRDEYGGYTELKVPMSGDQEEYWLSVKYSDWDQLKGVELAVTYPGGVNCDGEYGWSVREEKLIAETPSHWRGGATQHVRVKFEPNSRTRFRVLGYFAVE